MGIFGLKVFKKVPSGREQSEKVLLEASELCEAGKAYHELPEDGQSRRRLLEEYADVLQTLVNLADAFGITDDEILDACMECTERNDARGRI